MTIQWQYFWSKDKGWLTSLLVMALMVGCGSRAKNTTASMTQGNTAPTSSASPQGAGSGIPRPDLRMKSQSQLQQLGQAYYQASMLAPVTGQQDLGLGNGSSILTSPRDRLPFEIVWRVDPSKVSDSGNVLLAWESTADGSGNRYVLMADCRSVKLMTEEEFQKTPKAAPNS